MTINIEWQDQQGNWHYYQTKQNQADAIGLLSVVRSQQKSAIAWWMTQSTLRYD
jgi:hypothetical protein